MYVTNQIHKDKRDMKMYVTNQIQNATKKSSEDMQQLRGAIVQEVGQMIQEVETKINTNLGATNLNVGILVEAATRSSVAVGAEQGCLFNNKFMTGGTWSSLQDLCSAALNASQSMGSGSSNPQINGMELGHLEELALKHVECNETPFLKALCDRCNITFSSDHSDAQNIQDGVHRDKMVESLGEYYKAQHRSSQTKLEALKLVHDFYGKTRNSQDSFIQKLKQSNSLAFMIYIWSLDKTTKSFKNQLEIDCVGCSTFQDDDTVEVHLGEIKTSQIAAIIALAHGTTQLKLRLLALHAVMLLYEKRKILLTGHMFVAKRTARKLWGSQKFIRETGGNNVPVKIEVHDQILSSRLS